jgi:hypothetical protein
MIEDPGDPWMLELSSRAPVSIVIRRWLIASSAS